MRSRRPKERKRMIVNSELLLFGSIVLGRNRHMSFLYFKSNLESLLHCIHGSDPLSQATSTSHSTKASVFGELLLISGRDRGRMEPIRDLALTWLSLDRDETTAQEILDLLQAKDEAELELRLRKRITFGTAGLRAAMKAGFAFMNTLTVLQASQGLARYILDQRHDITNPNDSPSVVIGYDARYNSERFARLAAAAFLASGFSVFWFGQIVHTPMVPFAVKYYSASVGVMITASHNPKNDNGYKVYWKNASQIIPPHDVGIAAAIEKVDRIFTWDDRQVDHLRIGFWSVVTRVFDEAVQAYFQSLNDLALGSADESQGPRFVYTPMHGVGLPFMRRAVNLFPTYAGSMHVAGQQAAPDPEFPTVPFPNPEENGALDLAKSEADRRGISFIIANDPDADRFAFAEKVANVWHQFSGNQIGALFGSYIFETFSGTKSQLAMLASTVSSRMLASMAEKEEFAFRETLTGFKWLGNVAQDLQRQGYDPVYAYEEAIGYMFSSIVWDKDGIAAATVFLKALLHWTKRGLTPWSKLQQLYERYGYFEDANTYLISPSPDTTDKVFQDIRKLNNGSRPVSLGGRSIKRWRDLTLGYDTGTADGKPMLPVDASAQMITCELDDVVFTARGSGTEPKIKLYIEAKSQSSGAAKSLANGVLQSLLNEWFKPEYGLRLAGT